MSGSEKWVNVAKAADVEEGEMVACEVEGEEIAVYHLEDGTFHATNNICTHEYACLSDGWLEDGVVECPLHAGRFDVRTGKGMGPPIEEDLRVYAVRVDGDDILVNLSSGAG